jgi:L,D-transpeptidase YcbB
MGWSLEIVSAVMRRSLLAALAAPALLAAAPAPPPTAHAPTPGPHAPAPGPVVVRPPAAVPTVTPPPAPSIPRSIPTLTDKQEKQLRKMLADADANGIAPHAPTAVTAAMPAAGNTPALVQAVLDYAQALHSGRLAPSDYLKDWGLRPAAYDPWPTFVTAVEQDKLAAWIAALPPPYTGYYALRKGLTAYRAIDAGGGWPTIPAGADLAPGASDPRVATLRQRLAVEDKEVASKGSSYDKDLAEAVKRAQRRYGLEPTGTLNKVTLAALNVPAHERVRQIVANMERWRWLPPVLPTHRIQVNIAAAVLTVFEADSPVTSMRAVTGRPGDETPMLSSEIHSIVFNPPWNVPSSIATKELWPKEKAHPGYLRAHGYKIIETDGGGKRLQQEAGSRSALGKVKFDFNNPYGVYLHDTPTQGTFDRYSRLASHGCVRLAHPIDLAKLVLQGDTKWTPDAIDDAISKGDTVRAQLPQRIAVFLFYWTAFGSADGKMSFRGDPYGWDTELANRIEASANRAPFVVAAK